MRKMWCQIAPTFFHQTPAPPARNTRFGVSWQRQVEAANPPKPTAKAGQQFLPSLPSERARAACAPSHCHVLAPGLWQHSEVGDSLLAALRSLLFPELTTAPHEFSLAAAQLLCNSFKGTLESQSQVALVRGSHLKPLLQPYPTEGNRKSHERANLLLHYTV